MVRGAMVPASLAALLMAAPATAVAKARGNGDARPWSRGTWVPSVGLGAGFTRDLTTLTFGLGASYYVINGLALGLNVSDTVLIMSRSIKTQFPGIEDETPTNQFRVTPTLQWVFLRTRWFSPYLYGGLGPLVFNHGGGTMGEWVAGPGAFIHIAGPVYLDVGVAFSGLFPRSRCEDALDYQGQGAQFPHICTFNWGPRLGIALAFGAKRKNRRDHETEQPSATPTVPEPMPEPEPKAPEPEPTAPEPERDLGDPGPSPDEPVDEPAPDPESPNRTIGVWGSASLQ